MMSLLSRTKMILIQNPQWILKRTHPPSSGHPQLPTLEQWEFCCTCSGANQGSYLYWEEMMTLRNNGKSIHSNDALWGQIEENQYDWESKGWCHLLGQTYFGPDIYSCARGKLLEMEYGFLKLNFNVISETRPRGVIYRILHKIKYLNLYKMRKSSFQCDSITYL